MSWPRTTTCANALDRHIDIGNHEHYSSTTLEAHMEPQELTRRVIVVS